MQDTLSISDQGLRLIKAFEGYRPVDRELVSGRRVVGYGHRVDGEAAVTMTEAEASQQLLDDLAPFEDMLNSEVFASLTQSQFDALASLAFNIGPKAFLDSDVLRAVNTGRPLDAAQGFDAWRLARVGDDTYVIDALVRRRTAEKALFLRPPTDALAPKAPSTDLNIVPGEVAEDPRPVLDRDAAGRLVSDAPYDIERLITSLPSRRVEDGVSGEMAESELPESSPTGASTLFAELDSVLQTDVVADEDNILDLGEYAAVEETEEPSETEETTIRTAIADAADEVRDRLEALMDPGDVADADLQADDPEVDWPESLIEGLPEDDRAEIDRPVFVALDDQPLDVEPPGAPESADVVAFPGAVLPGEVVEDTIPAVIDGDEPSPVRRRLSRLWRDEATSDVMDEDLPSEDVWVPPTDRVEIRPRQTPWPYIIFLVIGGALFGTGAALKLREADRVFGFDAQLASVGLLMIGALILLGGLIYLVKSLLNLSEP